MKPRAFTLVELLVVVGIIALLTTIMVPSYSALISRSRQAVCASHLHQIMIAFKAAQDANLAAAGRGKPEAPFPVEETWPAVPYDMIREANQLKCPEDHRVSSDFIRTLKYQSAMGGHFIAFEPSFDCVIRRGRDDLGAYTEYAIEENPGWGGTWSGSIYGFSENDGVWRIYDGKVRRKLTLMSYTCAFYTNRLWFNGEMLWTNLAQHQKESLWLTDSTPSYGLNTDVGGRKSVNPDTIVLTDFVDRIIEPFDDPDVQTRLYDPESARHRGKLNVLFADGRITALTPEELAPAVFPDRWTPEP